MENMCLYWVIWIDFKTCKIFSYVNQVVYSVLISNITLSLLPDGDHYTFSSVLFNYWVGQKFVQVFPLLGKTRAKFLANVICKCVRIPWEIISKIDLQRPSSRSAGSMSEGSRVQPCRYPTIALQISSWVGRWQNSFMSWETRVSVVAVLGLQGALGF